MAPSKTKHESLEFVFGDPLQSLDPNIKPTAFSVFKHWIYHYDGIRGSKRCMSDTDKHNVISKVVESIISLPVYVSATLMSKPNLCRKLKRDIYGKNGILEWEYLQSRKDDQQWIKDRRTDLNEIYDVENLYMLSKRKQTGDETVGKKLMNILDENPWKVKSIKDFSCLKCPECVFFTKEQNYFEDHAIANHPLSAILFESNPKINNRGLPARKRKKNSLIFSEDFCRGEEVLDDVDHINVGDMKKEPTDLDPSKDPFDICDANVKHKDEHFKSSPTKSELSYNKSSLSSESRPKKRPKKQKIAENTNDQWTGGYFMDSLIDYDSLVDKASFNQFNQPEQFSSYKIENSANEEELETIDQVNDIKKELTDQDSSKDPLGNCDANVEPRSEYFSPHTSAHLEND